MLTSPRCCTVQAMQSGDRGAVRFEYLVEAASWFSSKELGCEGSDADNEQVRSDSNCVLGAAKKKICVPHNLLQCKMIQFECFADHCIKGEQPQTRFVGSKEAVRDGSGGILT